MQPDPKSTTKETSIHNIAAMPGVLRAVPEQLFNDDKQISGTLKPKVSSVYDLSATLSELGFDDDHEIVRNSQTFC